MSKDVSKLFVDANEKEIMTIVPFWDDDNFCTLSNKRLYIRGKCYHEVVGGYKGSKEELTIDLEDISAINSVLARPYGSIFLLCMPLLIMAVIISATSDIFISEFISEGYISYGVAIYLLMFIILCVIFIVHYIFKKFKFFKITYLGNEIAIEERKYDKIKMENFKKSLKMAIDSISPTPQATVSSSTADELKKYKDLLDAGAITQEEYDEAKKRILS